MDILYLLKESNVNEELIYSLRSLVNMPHEQVFFAGGCPKGIKNIIHIPVEQNGDKHQNSTNNLIAACKDERLSNDFILMNDDFFILSPIKNPAEELNFNRGEIQNVYQDYANRFLNQTTYMIGMQHSMNFLQNLGIKNPLSFELHIPIVLNKAKVLEMFAIKDVESIPVLHKRSLYGNLYIKHSNYTEDVKILSKSDFSPEKIKDKNFLSCSDEGWGKIKEYISDKFSIPSIYENP